jgi:hypothetical protein
MCAVSSHHGVAASETSTQLRNVKGRQQGLRDITPDRTNDCSKHAMHPPDRLVLHSLLPADHELETERTPTNAVHRTARQRDVAIRHPDDANTLVLSTKQAPLLSANQMTLTVHNTSYCPEEDERVPLVNATQESSLDDSAGPSEDHIELFLCETAVEEGKSPMVVSCNADSPAALNLTAPRTLDVLTGAFPSRTESQSVRGQLGDVHEDHVNEEKTILTQTNRDGASVADARSTILSRPARKLAGKGRVFVVHTYTL